MGIFLDTGFYLGLIHPKDVNHERSKQLLDELKTGKFGQIYTSNLIMTESVTLVAIRTKKHPKAMKRIKELFIDDFQIAILLRSDLEIEKKTWEIFLKINKETNTVEKSKTISFTDCSNISLCRHYNIDNIISFDSHFDGWLTRIF
ncbi:MAG: type II toxin-antitoxin system VapC family toxin [Candidatus Helarchaeota archaeon]